MFVKPKAGLQVRHPFTRAFIPDEGVEIDDNGEADPVPSDPAWNFYHRHGDVVTCDSSKAEPIPSDS